jgi:hypothetical protein
LLLAMTRLRNEATGSFVVPKASKENELLGESSKADSYLA